MSEQSRLHAIVRGKVQGVGFRYFLEEEAATTGLRGWVKNLPSGELECVAEGPRPELEALLKHLREGPPVARVESVDVEWEPARGDLDAFQASL